MKTIRLSESEKARIYLTPREDRGKGGFQSFMVRLQDKINSSGDLDLSPNDIETIGRYAAYDNGGYEGRLREAFGRHFPKLFPGVTANLFPGV